jgi:hypothetical protein
VARIAELNQPVRVGINPHSPLHFYNRISPFRKPLPVTTVAAPALNLTNVLCYVSNDP